MKVILAEKPSVARDIARVLGCNEKKDGYINGSNYAVTWAFGHLVNMAKPDQMKDEWSGPWNMDRLPMIPDSWRFNISKDGSKQFKIIKGLFNDPGTDEIICATDAGREGEHIFRLIYQESGCTKPIKRLWISSLTNDAIKSGFNHLKPGTDFDNLAAAAMSRAKADWLVGLNFTQAYTVHNGQLCTVGRVQTPTLALVVNRERQITGFQKSYYFEIPAAFEKGFIARYVDKNGKTAITDKADAQRTLESLQGIESGTVASCEKKPKTQKAPALYNLLQLQKDANKAVGLTAEQTLKVAQALYEKHKAISYPRTESQHLSTDMVGGLASTIEGLPDIYAESKAKALSMAEDGLKLGKAYVDDNKLTDHHAIIPTGKPVDIDSLSDKEQAVFKLVCERFLSIFLPECVKQETKIEIRIGEHDFKAQGTVTVDQGWRECLTVIKPAADKEPLPAVQKGEDLKIKSIEVEQKETKPPARFNDSTLLSAMKSAGKEIDDKDMATAMKENGLGTPATRAAIIERLIQTGYMAREKKAIVPTKKGCDLIDSVIDELKSPELTGLWEQKLKGVEDGDYQAQAFEKEINSFVIDIIPSVKKSKKVEVANLGQCPVCGKGLIIEGKKGYGCNRWKEGCKFVIWKTIARKKITLAQAQQLITKGRTGLIKGFKSKADKPFDAYLVLKDSKVEMEFEARRTNERKRTKKKSMKMSR